MATTEHTINDALAAVLRETRRAWYAFDSHLDPVLQWAGKADRTSFDIPTVSLHVHERVDPRSIIEAVRKRNGEDFVQGSLFSQLDENTWPNTAEERRAATSPGAA